jgi:cell division protein ZapA (FtsZ GTPase activity inhibitor)
MNWSEKLTNASHCSTHNRYPMSEISIKVTIAGRTYPLTVPASEEPAIRQAENALEEGIAFFQKNYAVKDKLDLLAMAALQVASTRTNAPVKVETRTVVETVVERVEVPVDLSPELSRLEALLDEQLG